MVPRLGGHGLIDLSIDLDAHNERGQDVLAAGAHQLGHGQKSGDNADAGVGEQKMVIVVDGVHQNAIGKRGVHDIGLHVGADDGGFGFAGAVGTDKVLGYLACGLGAPAIRHANAVQDAALCIFNDFLRNVFILGVANKINNCFRVRHCLLIFAHV
ncbi:hypothetical protein SDC9_119140 [bioreactor metagenome]|uniref:Uncharacterized protein n=1 Tax=bioreactor metagenome TaxID=1076179 RepID=A0A645C4P0_9ZZZZ